MPNLGGMGLSSDRSAYGSGETIGMSRFCKRRGDILYPRILWIQGKSTGTICGTGYGKYVKRISTKNPNRQSLLALNVSRISPAAVYYNAAAILAETDLGSFWQFMEQTRHYRREWVEYLRDAEIFSSRRWFTEDGAQGDLDLSGMPRFKEQSEGIGGSMQRAVSDIMILAVLNILFFMGAFVSFLRYDVI